MISASSLADVDITSRPRQFEKKKDGIYRSRRDHAVPFIILGRTLDEMRNIFDNKMNLWLAREFSDFTNLAVVVTKLHRLSYNLRLSIRLQISSAFSVIITPT